MYNGAGYLHRLERQVTEKTGATNPVVLPRIVASYDTLHSTGSG
jgi:hypothetical protein